MKRLSGSYRVNGNGTIRQYECGMTIPEDEDILRFENGILYVWEKNVGSLIGWQGTNIKKMRRYWKNVNKIIGCRLEKVVIAKLVKSKLGELAESKYTYVYLDRDIIIKEISEKATYQSKSSFIRGINDKTIIDELEKGNQIIIKE